MIDKHLDFLLDTWTSRVNDHGHGLRDFATSFGGFFSTTTRLIKIWSTKPRLVD